MWLKQSSLALLTVAVAVMVVSGQILVNLDETQKSMNVSLGSSLALHCLLKTDSYTRFRVYWFFVPSNSSMDNAQNISEMMVTRKCPPSMEKEKADSGDECEEAEMMNVLSNVTPQKSGWYFCKVTAQIPRYENIVSQRTQVIINSPKGILSFGWWIWILSGVSAAIVIVLLVTCVLLGRRCCRSKAEEPVYINTRSVARKQPSPRLGMPEDNLKTVPSSHSLQVPSPGRRYDEGKRRNKQ